MLVRPIVNPKVFLLSKLTTYTDNSIFIFFSENLLDLGQYYYVLVLNHFILLTDNCLSCIRVWKAESIAAKMFGSS